MSDREDRGRERQRSDSRNRGGDRAGSRDERGGGGERDAQTTSLLVRNLSYNVRGDEIKRLCARFGEIRDVYLPQDYYTRKPKGFAFVEFYNKKDAAEALESLDRYQMDGREISVVFAKDRRKTADEMRRFSRRDDSRDRRDNRRGGSRDRRRSRSRDRDYRRDGGRDNGRDNGRDRRDERRSPPRRRDSPPPAKRDSPSPPPRARDRSNSPPTGRRGSRSQSASPARDN